MTILAIGSLASCAIDASKILKDHEISCAVWDMRFAQPLCKHALEQAAQTKLVVTLEENSLAGGFGSSVLEEYSNNLATPKILRIGLPNEFLQQGSLEQLYKLYGLDPDTIASKIMEAYNK